jgi:uncharacterized protein (TIGR02466 family)
MTNNTITPLFSIPLYHTNLGRDLDSEEKKYVEENCQDTIENLGKNLTSKNTYVLNNSKFKNLKDFFISHVAKYFEEVISIKNNLQPYITQSWINYNNKNQEHHIHMHQNSIISGVFYVNSRIENDSIYFKKDDDQIFFNQIKQYNKYNCNEFRIPVETGLLLLFPSNLKHFVKTNKKDYTRISLSFNVFVKGTIGSTDSLNELILI